MSENVKHAERVKVLAQEFAVAAIVAAVGGRLGDSKPSREEADKKAAELLAAIDAMQSALDDAVAKLAERDAEVERLRKDAERLAYIYSGRRTTSDALVNLELKLMNNEPVTMDDVRIAIDAALSEEVQGEWIEYRGRDA